YSPLARVRVVEPEHLPEAAQSALSAGERVGILGLAAQLVGAPASCVTLATPRTVVEYARALYASLRRADELGLDVVLAVPPPSAAIGAAVVDRLKRAAASH